MFFQQFDYDYLVKVMNIGPTGGIVATLNRFVVIFDVLLDFNNDEIHLQQFSLTDIGYVSRFFIDKLFMTLTCFIVEQQRK